ncbi:MAG: hypothetical protein COZ80_04885 [Ignavibacteria bacterium CG_4_8_14_3_um_filter_37_9]|nr:hypothetical protein [Ignavibacteria bacterium]OIO14525.1 MAG: hypothetical protein AUJ54_14215 [Ignavibacteria bacterium CG1_02_37_35]PIP78207.1 MAG: hypothetical protein COW85_05010 [Ignavibacteria bacterium CG22_combo_CG10-13_8_21_14_all_37_15]PIS45657.1 MAG: hypothetical protein COT22_04110 [Ignavibacteria bacterium CG08_land_8_20_14_0_20_37_9]PIW99533.1 MAG: hypothetical protein COZ80_04885 [Ignavibacteria bacterium CG_4_8_14_3_um_filter_37_9]PIX93481.1 MAG: hypothetical protein COZ25_
MKAYEYQVQVDQNGKLILPDQIKNVLPKNETVRVLFLVDEAKDKKIKSMSNDPNSQEFSYSLLQNDEAVYDDF